MCDIPDIAGPFRKQTVGFYCLGLLANAEVKGKMSVLRPHQVMHQQLEG